MTGIIDNPKLENFARAFSNNSGGCRSVCACGKEFYDNYNRGYSWEPGELETLNADPEAIALDYSVSEIEFEGKTFCADCGCWHERALQIIAFIDSHSRHIAEWLTLEKKRKQVLADHSPVVEEP